MDLFDPPHKRAVLSGRDVKDIQGEYVADPFVLRVNNEYYMFMEVE